MVAPALLWRARMSAKALAPEPSSRVNGPSINYRRAPLAPLNAPSPVDRSLQSLDHPFELPSEPVVCRKRTLGGTTRSPALKVDIPSKEPAWFPIPETEDLEEPDTPQFSTSSSRTLTFASSSDSPRTLDEISTLASTSALPCNLISISLLPPTNAPPIHRIGPFKLLRAIDKGTYGTAFSIRDLFTSNVVCAKLFFKKQARSRRDRYVALVTELVTYKHIAAANENTRKWLMELHGVVQDEECVLFIMDLMHGDLFPLLNQPLNPAIIRRYTAQIALGINALHSMGIIHRDIKPENIFLTPRTYNVRIGDFSNVWLAPVGDDDGSPTISSPRAAAPLDWRRVYSCAVVGTKEYLAPEVRCGKWYGCMVDWWALGVLFYDLAVGRVLFPHRKQYNEYVRWQGDRKGAENFFAEQDPGLPPHERSLLAGLLSLDPCTRFRFEHLYKHPYFKVENGNIFDILDTVPTRLTRPGPLQQDFSSPRRGLIHDSEPPLHAIPYPVRVQNSTEEGFPEDSESQVGGLFDMFGWVSPNGMWASMP